MVNVPPVLPEEREELRQVYLRLDKLSALYSFEECCANPMIRGCMRATARAVRRAQEERRRQDPAHFELAP